MKSAGFGRAKILQPSELNRLFERGFISPQRQITVGDRILLRLSNFLSPGADQNNSQFAIRNSQLKRYKTEALATEKKEKIMSRHVVRDIKRPSLFKPPALAVGFNCALAIANCEEGGSALTLRPATTKGKLTTRALPMHPKLLQYLQEYNPSPGLLAVVRWMAGLRGYKEPRQSGQANINTVIYSINK